MRTPARRRLARAMLVVVSQSVSVVPPSYALVPLTAVNLVAIGPRVIPPPGLIYSTNPEVAEGSDNCSYFVKGPDSSIVVAELLGCLLAEEVGLTVPPVAAARYGDDVFAGSRLVPDVLRNVMPALRRPELVLNFGDLFNTIVVDAWLVNTDRNSGNCLASKGRDARVLLVMIDFEKSVALRGPYPIVNSANVAEARLWPSGELGTFLRGAKPAFPPPDVCHRIASVTERRLNELFDTLEGGVGPVAWRDNSIQALLSRRQSITEIAGRIWNAN